jgi:serine phosphatase RsbU (regulator of sigma subunit)
VNVELGVDEIVTLLYVLVDTERGVARVARAGHLPPALAHPDGTVQLIDDGGSPPLGTPGAERVDADFVLPSGGLLVLYTDGLVEDRVTGLDDGLTRLVGALKDLAPYEQSVGVVAGHLLQECGAGRGDDDIALLVARYT